MAQTAPDTEQLVREYADLWNDQAYARIADVVAESFVHVSPAAPDGAARGPAGVEAFMRDVTTGFPDFEVTVEDMLSSDELVMVEHSFTMTHTGEFNGIPPTGQTVELRSMAKCRAADGQLTELREYLNLQSVFDQLGVAEQQPPD